MVKGITSGKITFKGKATKLPPAVPFVAAQPPIVPIVAQPVPVINPVVANLLDVAEAQIALANVPLPDVQIADNWADDFLVTN